MEYLVLNDKAYECVIESSQSTSLQISIRESGKEWSSPVQVEFLGREQNELTLRVDDLIIKSFVYTDDSQTSHVFPVTSTEQFKGRCEVHM